MKKAIIFISSAAALTASAVILFRKCKSKKPMTFCELYEDNYNSPSECAACGGGERCCEFAEHIVGEIARERKGR